MEKEVVQFLQFVNSIEEGSFEGFHIEVNGEITHQFI